MTDYRFDAQKARTAALACWGTPANTINQEEIMSSKLIDTVAQALTLGGAKADLSCWQEESKAAVIAIAEFLENHYEDDPDVSIFDVCEWMKEVAQHRSEGDFDA
jgi:hypothetical protein